MKHIFISLVLSIISAVSAQAYDFISNGVYYTVLSIEDRTCEVSKHPDYKYSGDYVIPEHIMYQGETFTVTSIGYEAFEFCYHVTSVRLPNSIKKLGESAFDGTDISSIDLPDCIEVIPDYCFRSTELTSIKLPKSLKTIGSNAFWRCDNLSHVEFNDSLENIERLAFYHCDMLTAVDLPNSLKKIESSAFNSCINLKSIIIPASVTELGYEAFQNCSSLGAVMISGRFCNSNMDWPTQLGKGLFDGCTSLKALYFDGNTCPRFSTSPSYIDSKDMPALIGNTCKLFVRSGTMEKYKSNSIWASFKNIIEIDEFPHNDFFLNIGFYCSPENIGGIVVNWAYKTSISCLFGDSFNFSIIPSKGFDVYSVSYGSDNCTVSCRNNYDYSVSKVYGANNFIISFKDIAESIEAKESNLMIELGDEISPRISISPTEFDSSLIYCESSDSNVAIFNNGYIKALGVGEAELTFYPVKGSSLSTKITVSVTCKIKSLTFEKSEVTLNEGRSTQLSAIIEPDTADNKTLEWSSNDENIATVDQEGKVIAHAQGKATISAKTTDGSDLIAECIVNVIKLIEKITLSDTKVLLNVGESKTITADFYPDNATNKKLAWFSSNPDVAHVEDGVITALSDGEARIVAMTTDGSDIIAVCEVNISGNTMVEDIAFDDIVISAQNGMIVIKNIPEKVMIRIFQVSGNVLYREISKGEELIYKPNYKGLFIVIVGSRLYKVML